MGATRAIATVHRPDGSTLGLNNAKALEIYLSTSPSSPPASRSDELTPIFVETVIGSRAQAVAKELVCQYKAAKALGIPCNTGSDVY